jgi:hypothetical protein
MSQILLINELEVGRVYFPEQVLPFFNTKDVFGTQSWKKLREGEKFLVLEHVVSFNAYSLEYVLKKILLCSKPEVGYITSCYSRFGNFYPFSNYHFLEFK